MKLMLTIFISALALSATDPQSTKKTSAPAQTIKPTEIPKDAVQTEPGTFRHTDADGKKWIYRKTPWGVSRVEDKGTDTAPAAARTADASDGVKATEDGGMVRFERPGPFGVYKWQKKKSELDENERAALDRARASTKAKQD